MPPGQRPLKGQIAMCQWVRRRILGALRLGMRRGRARSVQNARRLPRAGAARDCAVSGVERRASATDVHPHQREIPSE
eukprot:2372465-Pleurochrysis_carterae.AAC.1